MDISPTQAAQMFAFGAAGTLSAAKVWQIMGKRRRSQPEQPHRELFPPDERDQIVRQIQDLRRENSERYNEYRDLRADIRRIADHLGIDV